MKASEYIDSLPPDKLAEFGRDVLEFLFCANGEVDSDQEISGADFVEYASNMAALRGLTP